MTMEVDREVNIPPGAQTAAAMVVALVTYTLVHYAVVSVVMIGADVFPDAVALLLWGTRPNVVRVAAALLGAAAGVWSARLVCDLTLGAYQQRPVFWMFAGVLGAMTLGKIWTPSVAQQLAVAAQYAAAMATAYLLYWRNEAAAPASPALLPDAEKLAARRPDEGAFGPQAEQDQ